MFLFIPFYGGYGIEILKQGAPVIILGFNVEQRLFGKESGLNRHIKLDGIIYQIIGINKKVNDIYEDKADGVNNIAFVPYTASGLGYNQKVGEPIFAVAKGNDLDAAIRQLRSYFDTNYDPEINMNIKSALSTITEVDHNFNNRFMVMVFLPEQFC